MSWSHKWIGKPAAVRSAVVAFSPSWEDTKREVEEVKPTILVAIDANTNPNQVLCVEASGSWSTTQPIGKPAETIKSFQLNVSHFHGDICT